MKYFFILVLLTISSYLKAQTVDNIHIDSVYYDTIRCKYGYNEESMFDGFAVFHKTNYKEVLQDTTLYYFKRQFILFLDEKKKPSRVQGYYKIKVLNNLPFFFLRKKI